MKEFCLENEYLKVIILPDLGGRIDSFVNKKNNKNWVWSNNNLNKSKVSKYSEYDSNWQGGWEELFPNDAIEDFSWGKGLDHGELWSTSWSINKIEKDFLELKTTNLDSSTVFNKSFKIFDNKLEVKYESDILFDDYFLFKLHLAIPVTERVEVLCDYTSVDPVDHSFGNIINENKNFFILEENSSLFDFAYVSLQNNNVLIKDEKSNTLKLSFFGELNHFWIFQTQGGWNNHNVIVLEPASNSKKIIKDAIEDGGAVKGPMKFVCSYIVELN